MKILLVILAILVVTNANESINEEHDNEEEDQQNIDDPLAAMLEFQYAMRSAQFAENDANKELASEGVTLSGDDLEKELEEEMMKLSNAQGEMEKLIRDKIGLVKMRVGNVDIEAVDENQSDLSQEAESLIDDAERILEEKKVNAAAAVASEGVPSVKEALKLLLDEETTQQQNTTATTIPDNHPINHDEL